MANTYIQLELFTESKGMLTYFKTQLLSKNHISDSECPLTCSGGSLHLKQTLA